MEKEHEKAPLLIFDYSINRMMFLMSLYVAALFVALTPGVLLSLPKGGSRVTQAAVHGLVFALVFHLTYKMVWRVVSQLDGFEDSKKKEAMKGMY